MRATAKLAPFQDDLAALRQRMQAAQASKDMLTMQSAMMKQRVLYEKADVNMATMAIAPLIQLPVTLGMFFGVKKMCDLPVEQLKWSGLSFLPDLTVADPTCTLPIISAVMMNVQLSLAMRDMVAAPHMAHVMNLFRVMSVVSIPLMWNLPSGVMVYVITSIVSIAAQTVLLRQPAVRRALNIPILSKQFEGKPATFRESIAYARKWWEDKKAEQEALIRAKKRGN
ncbi:hypothetical protein WOLCODRAFT_74732 [Wolfiporia cocos MD-104 SS10]|uniref:Membrane insertase YidC/Oxa/ALB C-terminal domain-containing protein n=1 Tax=Wolfiporia cocos (strain MD-104) TaxID=742152 RepID=A0A2H3JMS8_WOLCO|nr:hypothetical protein WOLCODRAFT_74732 [Wolfiporia cocos MD-104 SS10]